MPLKRLGCERVQGFLLGRPLLGGELTQLLRGLDENAGARRFC
ncbi:hypothetical protein ACAW63_22250 [Pseudomonas sp. QE6]